VIAVSSEMMSGYDVLPCSKRRLSKSQAADRLSVLLSNPDPKRQEQRMYYCWQCEAWHLTSQGLTEDPIRG
jgi:hypothetical protein